MRCLDSLQACIIYFFCKVTWAKAEEHNVPKKLKILLLFKFPYPHEYELAILRKSLVSLRQVSCNGIPSFGLEQKKRVVSCRVKVLKDGHEM